MNVFLFLCVLEFCTNICGDWIGEKAAGFQNRINNPRYLFYVSDDGMSCQAGTLRRKNVVPTSMRSCVPARLTIILCILYV